MGGGFAMFAGYLIALAVVEALIMFLCRDRKHNDEEGK